MDPAYRAAFCLCVAKFLHRGVFGIVDPSTIKAACILFLVFRDGKPRLCADQSKYTTFFTAATCVYESGLALLDDPSTSAFVLGDIWGAYQRLSWDEADRPYLGVIIVDSATGRRIGLVFRRPSFGLSHSPPQWEAAAGKVMAFARGQLPLPSDVVIPPFLMAATSLTPPPAGVRFVDDCGIPDRSARPALAVRGLRRLLAYFALFKVPPAVDKTYAWPCSTIVALGLAWAAPTRTVHVPTAKAVKFRHWCDSAVREVERLSQAVSPPTARSVQLPPRRLWVSAALAATRKVTGLLSFFTLAVPPVAIFRGPLDDLVTELDSMSSRRSGPAGQRAVAAQPAPPSGPRRGRRSRLRAARLSAGVPPDSVSPALLACALAALAAWRVRAQDLPEWRHRRFDSAGARPLRGVTDSSDVAWGAVVWVPGRQPVVLSGRFSAAQAAASSGYRELVPVRQVLHYLERHGLVGATATITFWTDSQVARSFMSRWSSTVPAVLAELAELWALVKRLDLRIEVHWCSREAGWLPLSDLITRLNLGSLPEYSLAPETFQGITESLGTFPQADLFATAASAQTPAFCARSLAGVSPQALTALSRRIAAAAAAAPDPDNPCFEHPLPAEPESGWLGDAFSIAWTGRSLYAYPPWTQLPKILSKWAADTAHSSRQSGSAKPAEVTSLTIVVTEELFERHLKGHRALVASVRVPSVPHLRDAHGHPCPRPPPWPGGLHAALLRS